MFKKRASYLAQDKKKNRSCINFINLEEILELLVISKLKCYYCKHNILILYNNVREPYQWTLDRIDNDKAHNSTNVVISVIWWLFLLF